MHCLACDKLLSDREASRKYEHCEEISNPEEQFIGLCNHCLKDTDITFSENTNATDEEACGEEETGETEMFRYDDWES